MSNKNNKQTMNVRTHNPFDVYQNKSKEASNSNNNNPNEEFAAEFDTQARDKDNKTRHRKDLPSDKKI